VTIKCLNLVFDQSERDKQERINASLLSIKTLKVMSLIFFLSFVESKFSGSKVCVFVTLGGELSHHCANPAPQDVPPI